MMSVCVNGCMMVLLINFFFSFFFLHGKSVDFPVL